MFVVESAIDWILVIQRCCVNICCQEVHELVVSCILFHSVRVSVEIMYISKTSELPSG